MLLELHERQTGHHVRIIQQLVGVRLELGELRATSADRSRRQ